MQRRSFVSALGIWIQRFPIGWAGQNYCASSGGLTLPVQRRYFAGPSPARHGSWRLLGVVLLGYDLTL